MAKWGHTFKAFVIIIKTTFYLLKINKRTNKKYLRDSNFFDILLVFFYFLQAYYDIFFSILSFYIFLLFR